MWLPLGAGLADWSSLVLTAALVAVTTYYAVQNHRMVSEMRASRKLTVLPKLAAELNVLGPQHADILLRNVGPGPALDVDVMIVLEPTSPATLTPDKRRFRAKVMAPGEQHEFLPQSPERGGMVAIDTLTMHYSAVRVRGTMRDALGDVHQVDEAMEDLAEWRQLRFAAGRRRVPDPVEVLSK